MAIEQGIVIKMGPQGGSTAWVKTIRSSACESCASRDSCKTGSDGQSQEVEAINQAGARVGDRIQLAISTVSMLKAMSLLYLFPILCLIGGGVVGERMAPSFQADPSIMAAVAAAVGFAAALLLVRVLGQRMGQKESYQPKIIRVLGREPINHSLGGNKDTCDNGI